MSQDQLLTGALAAPVSRRRLIGTSAAALGALAVIGVAGSQHALALQGSGTEFDISTEDIKFVPNELTIPANTEVKIKVTNKGVLQHDFHVDKLDITSKLLNSGESDTVTIKAAPGTYDFWCTVPGHKEAGMTGTLTVVEGGGGSSPASSPAASPAASAQPAESGGHHLRRAIVEIAFQRHALIGGGPA